MSAVLSLGSNLGDRRAHLAAALLVLEPTAVSPLYETAPVGGVAQADFLNLVVLVPWDAAEAWDRAQRAEQAADRTREVRWGPRTLDVDVVVADGPPPPGLVLPHPRAHERAFVLVPWLDLDRGAALPQGRVADLLAALADQPVRRAADQDLRRAADQDLRRAADQDLRRAADQGLRRAADQGRR